MPQRLKNIQILIVLLLILSVAGSSLWISKHSETDTNVKTEQASKEKQKSSEQKITKPSEFEAVVPFFEFGLIKDSYLISKLDFKEVLKEEVCLSIPIYTSKYFKTLFCFVISPNAP